MKSTDDASLNTTEIEPTTKTGEFCLRFFIILMRHAPEQVFGDVLCSMYFIINDTTS